MINNNGIHNGLFKKVYTESTEVIMPDYLYSGLANSSNESLVCFPVLAASSTALSQGQSNDSAFAYSLCNTLSWSRQCLTTYKHSDLLSLGLFGYRSIRLKLHVENSLGKEW